MIFDTFDWGVCSVSLPLYMYLAKCIRGNLEFVNTLTDPIYNADANLYPNVHVILKLRLTLPVGSCTCEGSSAP
jgi:hypothetical protein